MKLQDVAINSFQFFAGLKGPEIKAMAQFKFEGVNHSQIVWVDLTPEESQFVVAVARKVEERLASDEAAIPEEAKAEAKRSMGFRSS
jgi:hypothetical protein